MYLGMLSFTFVCMCACMFVGLCMHVCMIVCMYVHIYIYIYMYEYVYINTCMYVHDMYGRACISIQLLYLVRSTSLRSHRDRAKFPS